MCAVLCIYTLCTLKNTPSPPSSSYVRDMFSPQRRPFSPGLRALRRSATASSATRTAAAWPLSGPRPDPRCPNGCPETSDPPFATPKRSSSGLSQSKIALLRPKIVPNVAFEAEKEGRRGAKRSQSTTTRLGAPLGSCATQASDFLTPT